MSIRMEIDFARGLAQPTVEEGKDGILRLCFARNFERVEIRLSLPSLEALHVVLMLALARLKRC